MKIKQIWMDFGTDATLDEFACNEHGSVVCDCAIERRHRVVRTVLEAVLPKVAGDIVSDGPKHPYTDDQTARINAWCEGLHTAARIVRGEET